MKPLKDAHLRVLIVVAIVLIFIGLGLLGSLAPKVEAAYCASGYHFDPCAFKGTAPWVYCGELMANPEICMTSTDTAIFLAGFSLFYAGIVLFALGAFKAGKEVAR